METNNGRPTQDVPTMEATNWRTQLPQADRQKIINKIMDTLMKHVPSSEPCKVSDVEKITLMFEQKIFKAATSKKDYMQKISLKLMSVETMAQHIVANSLPSILAYTGENAADQASRFSQPQLHEQGQSLSKPLASQSQACKQLLSQNVQNNIASAIVQSSVNSTTTMTPVTGSTQIPMLHIVDHNSKLQTTSGISQNLVGNLAGQVLPSNNFANSQRQMQGRQHSLQVVPQLHQQQSQNSQQYPFEQQRQHQLLKQNFKQGNITCSVMQTEIQQGKQQQSILSPTQLQPSQQSVMQVSSVMQPSVIQSVPLSGLPQNQQSSVHQPAQSVLQQHPQSVLRQQQQRQPQQATLIHQQQTTALEQPILPPLQQQQLMGQLPNAGNIQQDQSNGQRNSVPDMQNQLQLLGQNNCSSTHLQQLGWQSNVSRLGAQSGNYNMHNDHHNIHAWQQARVAVQQQAQQTVSALLPNQGQQSQPQPTEQQLMSQIQSQPAKLQQQPNPLKQDMQQTLKTSDPLLQSQHVIQQRQRLSQSQSAFPLVSSMPRDFTSETGAANKNDCLEELYQKVNTMKEMFLPELNELFKKLSVKLQQLDSLPQQPKTVEFEKLKKIEHSLKCIITFLHLPKCKITDLKGKVGEYEKRINSLLELNRRPKPVSSLQQGQLLPLDMQSLQPSLQPQSQNPQVQPHGNQIKPHLQSMNLHHSVTAMNTNNLTSLEHGSMISSKVTTSQQNMMNSQQPGTNLDAAQGNAVNSLIQNPVGTPQNNTLLSRSGGNVPQLNINPLKPNPNILQNMNLKQQKEQLMVKAQQGKQQFQQHHHHHQMPHLPQRNELTFKKGGQRMGVKAGILLQHHSVGQCSVNNHQGVKSEPPSPISSPQLLQAASPQFPQHSSPQIDQKFFQTSLTKAGTPLQSPKSPSIGPSLWTPLVPSLIKSDPEELISLVSSLSNSENNELQQTTGVVALDTSFVVSTPGLSASPLLGESTDLDGYHDNISTMDFCESSFTEQPLQRLIKVVRSMSHKALSASVSDMESVVSMAEMIAGSMPGNGSRSAVGEDLVAMTSGLLQRRNYSKSNGITGTRKMRRYLTAMPSNIVSSAGSINDSFKKLTNSESSDMESSATSCVKRPRIEENYALLKEIWEINQQLINTVVDISPEGVNSTAASSVTEGGEGTFVMCSFSVVAVSPNLKSQHASAQMSPILPLRLLVPTNYPNCSPVLLDKLPAEVSTDYEDLSVKAKSMLSLSLRSLLQPLSLGDIARTWDICAHTVISEYAEQNGGGNFSSRYGTWEKCLSAA